MCEEHKEEEEISEDIIMHTKKFRFYMKKNLRQKHLVHQSPVLLKILYP